MLNLAELRKKRDTGEDGFTLIELLVVVVIIGILIAIAIPVYLNYQKGANDKAAQSDLRNAISVLEQCNSDAGKYPASTEVPTAGGALTATNCTSQKINLSSNTSIKYIAGTNQASFVAGSSNSSGSGKVWCYNSANGGSVKNVGTTAIATAADITATTC